MTPRALLPLLALLALPRVLLADTDAAALQSLAEQTVRAQFGSAGSRVVIVPAKLNPRLHFADCSQPLKASLPQYARTPSRVAVSVRCQDQRGWAIQVPVQLQVFRQVLVTTRPLARGDSPGPADVHMEERDITRLGYGYVDSLDQLTGRSLARPLIEGTVLGPNDLNGRQIVQSGEQVALIADLDGIEVRAEGAALDGGDTGAHLRVRNLSSGKVIDAVVSGPGEVKALP